MDNIDFATLTIENTSFINEQLNEVFSDAIFKCKIKESNKEFFISILIEHKSYQDKYISVQLLNYLANAYLSQLKESNELELVVPFIYYHGKENWSYKPLAKLIKNLPDYLMGYAPDFNTVFIDLNLMTEDELKKINNLMLLSALYMQKYSFYENILISKIIDIFTFLEKSSKQDRNFIRNIFVYFNELVEIDTTKLISIIDSLSQNTKQEIMTTYQLIKQEGRKEGIEKGMEKGIEKAVTKLYKKQFNIAQIADIMELPVEKVKDILKKNGMV